MIMLMISDWRGGAGGKGWKEKCVHDQSDLSSFQSRLINVYEKELNVHTSFFSFFPFFFSKYTIYLFFCVTFTTQIMETFSKSCNSASLMSK